MTRPSVEALVAVVPARNEQALLGGCLRALSAAVERAREAGLRCEVRVVLDTCTDDSRRIASGFDFPVLESSAGRVGAARRFGIAVGLMALRGVSADRTWIACTDADSEVPPQWLLHQVDISHRADVYIGTVRPDFSDLAPQHRQHWLRTHPRGRRNESVHGTNLGVRARTYLDVGGFAAIGEHEDVDLVARCRARGAVVIGDDHAEVFTSGRFVGRTPGGYARYLRSQSDELVGDAAVETS